jgi:conjugal transfer pilus assembly protein TraF
MSRLHTIATLTIALGAGPLGAQSTPTATGRPAPEATAAAPQVHADPPPLTYLRGTPEGFYWYREREPVLVVPAPPPSVQATPPTKRPELVEFEAMQAQLEELKKVAIMDPSIANLRAFMRYQGMVLDKAGTFAEQWQRTLALSPDLDTSDRIRPTNTAAARSFDERQGEADRAALAAYAKTHGLYFYFRSDCPYCHAFAPVVKRFADNTGFTVMAISLDGGVLPDFPQARRDNGSAARVIEGGITTVPALVLMDPRTGARTPVGFGVMSDGELAERLRLLLRVTDTTAQAAR